MAGPLAAMVAAVEDENKKEPKMAVFSVIKKGSILKHIFLNVSLKPNIAGGNDNNDGQGSGEVETLLIGRHPDCHIVLDHPSISRFHLELRLSPSHENLSVVDRSSVHGTWISGTRIPPNVPVGMVDGDVLSLGSSTRAYRLQWVSSSRAFEMENPLPPLFEEPEEPHQDDSDQRLADASELWVSEIPTAPPLIELMKGSLMQAEEEQHSAVCEEALEEKLAFFPADMMSACLGSPPSMVEENCYPQIESAFKEPSDVEQLRLAEHERREVTSSILSRRKKSKSVGCLRIQTGRSRERVESILADKEDDERTEEVKSIVCEDADQQDTVCRVLFGDLDGQEEDKENSFNSDKENMTPMSTFQKMNKNVAVLRKSSAKGESILVDKEADEKTEEDNSIVCEHADQQDAVCRVLFGALDGEEENKDNSFDSDKENMTPMSTFQKMNKNVAVQQKSSARVESILPDKEADGTEDVNSIVCEHPDQQNTLCRVLFGALDGQEEDNENSFDSDKENMTPMSTFQKMDKNVAVQQKSSARLEVAGDLKEEYEEKQKSLVQSEFKHTKSSSMKFAGHQRKKWLFAATIDLTEKLNDFDKKQHEDNILTDLISIEPSSQKFDESEKEGTSALDETTLANAKADEGTDGDNDIVFEHVEQQDALNRVLFGNGQDEDRENKFDSDKENMTLMSAQQKMSKSIAIQQESSSTRLVVAQYLKINIKEKQTSMARSDFKHKENNPKKFAKNPTEIGLCAATSDLAVELINLDKEKHEHCSLVVLDSQECSSQKFYEGGKEGNFALDPKSFRPASGCKLKKIQNRQLEPLPGTSNITENWNDTDKEKQAFYVPCDLDLKEHNSENFAKCYTEEVGSFGSDKENMTPISSHKLKKAPKHLHCFIAALDIVDPNSDKEISTPNSCENTKLRKPLSENLSIYEDNRSLSGKKDQIPEISKLMKSKETPETSERIKRQIMKNRVERIPFQSLLDNSPSRSDKVVNNVQMKKWLGNCNSSSTDQIKEVVSNSSIRQTLAEVPHEARQERRIWNIVVDTDCLLDDESRKSLQLLEGIRGTHLIIPRIVIRELDNLKRHESFFRKSTSKASAILQWIEECMVNLSWWIHVQSSSETMPIAPTPPVTPRASYDIGNDDLETNSLAFSSYGSLTEIISPTAEDHILDCALLFKKVKSDGHLVLLSNSITLKIKAMAEGLLCETAKEFRESLVNPFSKRFLWADSSPRGSTWSSSEEVGLLEKYYHQHPVIRKPVKATEAVKGLKLILLHNSQYGQSQSVK